MTFLVSPSPYVTLNLKLYKATLWQEIQIRYKCLHDSFSILELQSVYASKLNCLSKCKVLAWLMPFGFLSLPVKEKREKRDGKQTSRPLYSVIHSNVQSIRINGQIKLICFMCSLK